MPDNQAFCSPRQTPIKKLKVVVASQLEFCGDQILDYQPGFSIFVNSRRVTWEIRCWKNASVVYLFSFVRIIINITHTRQIKQRSQGSSWKSTSNETNATKNDTNIFFFHFITTVIHLLRLRVKLYFFMLVVRDLIAFHHIVRCLTNTKGGQRLFLGEYLN